MSNELLSILKLILPIILYLLFCLCFVLVRYGQTDFKLNFISSFIDGLKIFLYPASLYYISIIFDAIHTDSVMEKGIKIILGICWLVSIIKLANKEEKEE